MRYEDTSSSVGNSATPEARDDADALATGSNGPATGNVITGAGTLTGLAGADGTPHGHVVEIRGAGGTDTADKGQGMQVDGRYGALVIDENGNYKYVADGHAPEEFRDLFQYTLEDSKGGRSMANLIISRGAELKVADNAQRIVPGPDGVVTLPAGVDLNDVHVLGRDLVVTLPDGSQIVIVDGAVFVPQLVLGGVEVPSTNLASLLVQSELITTAGAPQSSGGNFDVPVPPLDPGVPLGDLIPPTELHFGDPIFEEIGQLVDRDPEAGSVSVLLDDDDVPGKNGNAGGTGDDAGSPNATTSGVLPGSGGDGALTWDLLSSGAPAGFSYVDGPNGSILVQQVQDGNTVTVLTITIDPTDGSFTVTENNPIRHATGDNENNANFTINYTVTDSDGDVAAGTLNINVDDDTPTVSVTAGSDAQISLTTHDALTPGAGQEAVSTTADFGNVFGATSSSPGADGAGAGSSSGYALSTTGGASGLFSHGVAINLYNVGGVIVGSTSATAPATATDPSVVFSVSTTNTGIVTLTQYQQIDHTNTDPSPTGTPFEDHSISLADGAITLTRTLTVVDKDGDSVTGSAAVQIGANLHFLDDGPTIGIADRGEPTLNVDETDLNANATASFAANFSASFGADGPAAAGSITYALGINAGATGLVDVATGQAIVLVNNNGVIEGHVGNAAGALAFTVSVNAAGDVTLDQIRALQHPNPANPDDSVTLASDNLVTLTATAHDFDGDTASTTLNIGQNLSFDDDGPSINTTGAEPDLTVDETVLATNATASVAGAFSSAFGADGAGTVSYALGITGGNGTASGLIDVATGQSIVLVNNAGVIEGHVGNAAGALAFTVTIDGTGNVTLDQIRAIQHPDPANPDDSVTLANDNLVTVTATVTDKDGDQASATINFGQNLHFEDDGPSITLSGSEATLTVDETVLATNATASFASAFTPAYGADGAGSVSYSLTVTGGNGTASGLIDVATGQSIVLVNNAGVIEGHVGNAAGALAFTVSVNAAGDVTLDQIRAVQHPDPNNPDDSVTLANDNLIVLNATVTDKDGDTASTGLNIGQNLNFEDDGPSINANGTQPNLTVDETVLATNATASFAGVFNSSFGADGAGSITYALGITGGNGTASGLIDVATGQSIVLVNNNGVIEGHVGNAAGALAFTVSIDAGGTVTLDQIRAIQHPNPANPDDSVTLANDNLVTITATITDKDGDSQSAVANIGQNLNFEDDGPSINANGAQPSLTVDETVLATNATASFAGVFNSSFGADGAGTVAYALGISAPSANSGLTDTLTGQAIVLVQNGAVVEGHVGNAAGALAFTVSVDGSGNVTLDQIRAVVHPNTLNPDDSVTLSADNLVTLTATVTDKDGDSQSATANIGQNLNFEDDGPSAVNDSDTVPSGGNTAQGNVITGIGTDGGVATADNAGADQGAHITAIQGTDGTDTTFSGGLLSIHGTHGTLEIDANGNYTYTRDPGSPGTVQDVFTYTLTDGDGDSTTATLTINISDAAPNPPAPITVLLDDDALAGGNANGPGDRTPDTQNTTGNLVATGGDGDLDYFIAASQTLPTGFTSVTNTVAGVQTMQISQNGTLVITVTLNNETGAYTVTQNAPIMHALDGNTEGENPLGNVLSAINVNVFAQDADGDQSGNAIISISVDDDTPTVTANGTQPSLTVDETVLATNATADFSGIFSHSFGADGAAAANSITYALGITGGNGVDSGLDDVATGQNIVLVLNGSVVEGHVGNAAGALAFTVSVDGSGNVTLDQIRAITHPNTANPDDSVSLANDNLITLTQTVTDKDGDQASATANIGQNLNFEDDGPTAAIVETGQGVSVDESVGVQIDSNDTTNAGIIALFAGVGNKGVDTDLPQYATNASAIVASTGSSYGADGAGTTAFSLNVSSAGVDSGLDTTDGQSILLYKEGNLIVGRVGSQAGPAAFAIAIDPVTGQISMVEYLSIKHPSAANPDDSVSIADGAVQAVVTVTDRDGDSATSTPTNIGSLISFQDSGPVMTAAQNMNIQNSVDVAHTAQFAFNLGADGANISTNDVITNVTGSATVGGVPVQNWTLTPGAEDATTASYSFSFDYSIGGGNTAHETGTLVFDKVAGTYTIDLANPIQGVTTILQTATGTLFQGYEFGTSTPDGSQPAISVTQIQDLAGTANDIYVQFTGVAEPSSGTGDNNLEFSNWVPGANNPAPVNGGGDTTWNPGQVFNQTDSWVSTSNDANGVAGDTVQGGEVLDFNLVQGLNPTGILADPSTYAQASSMFLKFDGIGSGEDMIVVLKLYDTVAHTYTTVALMVQNSDIQKGPGTGPGIYSGITLDQNDGLIVIEPNDYQQGNTNLVIVGAQIAGSDEGLSGTAIDFTYGGVLGVASTGTQAFSTDTDDGPFKISSIGFTTVQTTPQNAQLDFNVTVTDGDGDSITQAISATVTAAADSTSAATIPAANTTVAPVVLDLNGDGVHFVGTDAGVHYDYGNGSVSTAWASPQDGILVNDANDNGTVDNASEFVFGSGGVTDLQALAAYDSNHDGQLSSADAGFANFAVWQDANSNGVADAGEVQSLTARGIASISLSSDGIAYSAAGGDVQVAGSGTYTRVDGSTGSLADAAFLTGDRAASVSNTALIGAIAAAGLASQAAAASTHASLVATTAMAGLAVAHNQALSPVALDYAPDMHASTLLSPQVDLHGLMEAQASIMHASDFGESHMLRLDPGHSVASQAPMQFLQGTQMPAHEGAAAMTAASIVMPSAQQLVGAGNGGISGAQHNAVVGQVLAEALHGGAGVSLIDHALASLPGHGGANALEALASHGGLGVPNGDAGVFAAFTAAHSPFNMEAMVVHADAVQTHA